MNADGKGHTKRDCTKYKDLLENSGGKRPANYEGAFEKARKTFGEKHANAFTGGPNRQTNSSQRPEKGSNPGAMQPPTESDAEQNEARAFANASSSCGSSASSSS